MTMTGTRCITYMISTVYPKPRFIETSLYSNIFRDRTGSDKRRPTVLQFRDRIHAWDSDESDSGNVYPPCGNPIRGFRVLFRDVSAYTITDNPNYSR